MLINLSKRNDYRSLMQQHKRTLRRYWGYTREELRDVGFEHFFIPTKYVGVYNVSSHNCNDKTIKAWCKQSPAYNRFYRRARQMRESGMTSEEIWKAERNAWDFGVADNVEQVIDYYNNRDFNKGNHVIFYQTIRKESSGGWRWHKWGQYIGKQEPCCEYLYDEPEIEEIITYSIYQVV